jgi:hypothetical protein
MNTFILVMFWSGVIGVVGRLACLVWCEYPRRVDYSRGDEALYILVHVAFAIWASRLLWS